MSLESKIVALLDEHNERHVDDLVTIMTLLTFIVGRATSKEERPGLMLSIIEQFIKSVEILDD